MACLEAYRQEFPQHFPLIDELYTRQLRFDGYRVTSIEELAEFSEGLGDGLARLAAVHPEGVYSLVHAFDLVRLNVPRRDSLKTALSNFGRSGMLLARTIGRTFRPRQSELTHAAITESTLVSIVVPAFNADATLPRCIGSLLGQTHRNIEVIVVNDASTDGTSRVLGELAARDNRLRVENLAHNVGVHAARRIGVRASRGNFIGFADSDDWMAPGMYAHLLQEAQRTGAEIVVCGADCVSEDGLPLPPKVSFPVRRVFEDDLLARFCRLEFGSGLQWNKLYRAPLIRRYSELELSRRFGDGPEDYIVNVGCFASARRVVTVPERHCSYVIRSQSSSNSISTPGAFLRVLGALRGLS